MSNVGTIGHEKTFVIPEPTTPLTKELNTRMHALSLAIAKETGQLDTVASELQAANVHSLEPIDGWPTSGDTTFMENVSKRFS